MTTPAATALAAAPGTAGTIAAADEVHLAYRADIDGLRALAVLSVLAFHFFPSVLPGGFVGVDVFFVISGYLISQIIVASLQKQGFGLAAFYGRRVRRLFPALLVVLAAALAFGWIALLRAEYAQLGEHAFAGAAFLANFAFWSESGYFDRGAEAKPLLHLWSLGVEEQFYIFWPVILALAWKKRANLLLVAGAIALLSFAASLVASSADPAAAFYSPWTRFWELMIGAMLACLAARRGTYPGWDLAARPRAAALASMAGVSLIVLGVLFARAKGFPGWQALLPTAGAALVILAGPAAPANRAVLSRGALVAIGLISYPLYLWHWPLLSFARIVHGELGADMRALLLALAVFLAVLTHLLVERPVKSARRRGAVALALVALMAALGAAGWWVAARSGVEQREVVRINVSLESTRLALYPPFTGPCRFLAAGASELLQCHVHTQEPPRFALLGDSKARALFPALFRTSAGGGAWMFLGSGPKAPLVPVLSDSPAYAYVDRRAVELALRTIESTRSIDTVVIATATRALFDLGNARSIAGLPASSNGKPALEGLDAAVSRLLAAGKRVVLVVDNPTLPHMEDCVERRTSSAFVNRLLAAPPNPACEITVARHLELSRPYRELLEEVQRRHPGKVTLFDTIPVLCDGATQRCTPALDGQLLYGWTDHVSEHAARRLAQALGAHLRDTGATPASPAARGRAQPAD